MRGGNIGRERVRQLSYLPNVRILLILGTIQKAGHLGLLLARTLRAMLAAHAGKC